MSVENSMATLKRLQRAVNAAVWSAELGNMVSATPKELDDYWPKGVEHYDLLIGDFAIDVLNDPHKINYGR
jgi:hypothetical protein